MKQARKKQTRRDRRKAKQSGWKRAGKSNTAKVGHGGSGMVTGKKQSRSQQKKKPVSNEEFMDAIHSLRVSLALLAGR